MQADLSRVVDEFARVPMTAARTMRQMLGDCGPEEFLAASIPLLKSSPNNLGTQYLLTLLLSNGLILTPLIDPSLFSLKEAIVIAKQLVKIDPVLDVKMMPSQLYSGIDPDELDRRFNSSQGIRLLEITAAVSDGTRVLPVMSRLMHHRNPKVRSKAALLVGRSYKSCKWVEQRLAEDDPRVRANAVESLWGANSPDAKDVFWAAVRDPDNRVAGNALLGLYQSGDVASIPLIVDMAADPRTDFRVTVTWLMGETADPRFLSVLARLICDPEPRVRATAFRAIAKLKQVGAKITPEQNLQVRLLPQPTTEAIWRQAGAVIWEQSFAGAQPVIGLHPTQFVLYDDCRLVTKYSIKENFQVESLFVCFVLPRIAERDHPFQLHCENAFLAAFEHKRKGDAWLILKYLSGDRVAPAIPQYGKLIYRIEEAASLAVDDPMFPADAHFHTDPDSILNELDHPANRMLLPQNPMNAVLSLMLPLSHCRGARVVVLIYRPETTETNVENWKQVIKEANGVQVIVHVVAFSHQPDLADLCAKTGGTFTVLAGLDQLEAAVEALYAGLIHNYSIRYCPPAKVDSSAPSALKVRIYRPTGFGEGSLLGSLAMPHSEVA